MYRFLIYVDDLGQKFPSLLEEFQRLVLTANESPDGAFLQAFREHLTDMYHFWDPIPANCITLAAMDFINGCLLEEMPIIRDMKISKAAHSWPYYLRTKTGSASAYAFMLFPKEINPDMSVYIQVIEDISLYTNLVNDILSYVFHRSLEM
jgi:Trichodiene synthase (TRI5)